MMRDQHDYMRDYMRDYRREKQVTKKVMFTASSADDMRLLDWLTAQPEGISPYLKRLIRQDMDATKEEQHDEV